MMTGKKRIENFLTKVGYYAEVLISIVLLLAVIFLFIELVIESGIFWPDKQHMNFNTFLAGMFNLIIGVEFTKMLCKHTPDTVVDVLMFAVARQIIINHDNIWDNVLSVATLAGLFAVRKFLIPKVEKKKGIAQAKDKGTVPENDYDCSNSCVLSTDSIK